MLLLHAFVSATASRRNSHDRAPTVVNTTRGRSSQWKPPHAWRHTREGVNRPRAFLEGRLANQGDQSQGEKQGGNEKNGADKNAYSQEIGRAKSSNRPPPK